MHQIKLEIADDDQPQASPYRFRYDTDSHKGKFLHSVSSIPGLERSPAVTVNGYVGWVNIRCTCVTVDSPHRPHPFKLSGSNCNESTGVWEVKKLITENNRRVELNKVGILCPKLRELAKPGVVVHDLKRRNVNPFNTPLNKFCVKKDGHSIRLCFEAEPIVKSKSDAMRQHVKAADPIVCNIISDKKDSKKLEIFDLVSHQEVPATPASSNRVAIFCSKVTAGKIHVRFSSACGWSQTVKQVKVHGSCAIIATIPTFCQNSNIPVNGPVEISVQLIRPSSDDRSDTFKFYYLPDSQAHDRHNSVERPATFNESAILKDEISADDGCARNNNTRRASKRKASSSTASTYQREEAAESTSATNISCKQKLRNEIAKRSRTHFATVAPHYSEPISTNHTVTSKVEDAFNLSSEFSASDTEDESHTSSGVYVESEPRCLPVLIGYTAAVDAQRDRLLSNASTIWSANAEHLVNADQGEIGDVESDGTNMASTPVLDTGSFLRQLYDM